MIQASLTLGGIAAGADDVKLAALAEYGRHFGLVFQITDDLLATFASEGHHFASSQHGLHAEHVIRRHAVFQAVCAPGIERHVATDGADRLA